MLLPVATGREKTTASLAAERSFAFETTLSTRSYKSKMELARHEGYSITLLFFWLQTIELAKERVQTRVKEGGHDIKPDVIERRYIKGIKNLFDIYLPIVDGAFIFDNSFGRPQLIAQKLVDGRLTVIDSDKFNEMRKYYDYNRKTN